MNTNETIVKIIENLEGMEIAELQNKGSFPNQSDRCR